MMELGPVLVQVDVRTLAWFIRQNALSECVVFKLLPTPLASESELCFFTSRNRINTIVHDV